jgi:hypothetical protein
VETVARQAFYAAVVAGLVLTAAITIPTALSSIGGGSGVADATALRSSIGTTASADQRIEDLGMSTFVGRVPYVQQLNYYGAASTAPSVQGFVLGARQAELASYVTDVGEQVTLRYLSNAVETTQAVGAWKKASDDARAAETQRQATTQLAAAAARPWEPVSIGTGTRLSSRVTFYECDTSGFCGNMASGIPVSAGYAACSYNLAFGTRFRIDSDPSGRVWTCADRGLLPSTHVDVWFYSWSEGNSYQSIVGTYSTITILG